MNTITSRLVAIALAALATFGSWQYVNALRADLATARNDARGAHETVGRRDTLIANLQKQERDHARQLARLETTRRGIAANLAARESELETLKRESETVRAWAAGALPDDVMRLYASPALVGGDAPTLRTDNGLHDARNGAAH
jgi:LysB family phage lysis regulatory protein